MQRLKNRLLSGGLAICFTLSSVFMPAMVNAAPEVPSVTNSTSIYGYDQYETAAKIAQNGWTETSDFVILAAGMPANLIDALAAGPLAAKLNAPIILTEGNTLTKSAKDQLTRLQVKKVYVTSGPAVIKQSVIDEVKTIATVTEVKALGGYDASETSVNIAKEMANQGVQISQVVVTGGAGSDALSIAPIAGAQGMPILYTSGSSLSNYVKTYLDGIKANLTKAYIIGGAAVVSDAVKSQIPGTVKRYSGQTQYDTNIEVLKQFSDVLKNKYTYVANGKTLVDALAGAPLAVKNNSLILLTGKTLPEASKKYAQVNLSPNVIGLGGEAVVPASVLSELSAYETISVDGASIGSDDSANLEQLNGSLKVTGDNVTVKNVKTNYSIYVQGDNVTLDNLTVQGTIFLDPGDNGSANLQNVKAINIVILSGAEHSIHLMDVIAQLLNVQSSSPNVHVDATGSTTFTRTQTSSTAIFEASDGSFFGTISITYSAQSPGAAPVVELKGTFPDTIQVGGGVTIIAAPGSNISNLEIVTDDPSQTVTLKGDFEDVEINSEVNLTLGANTTITNVVANTLAKIVVPSSSSITHFDPKNTGTTPTGGGSVGGKENSSRSSGSSNNDNDDNDDNEEPVLVSTISINQPDQTLSVEETLQLTVTFVPANTTNKGLTWTSSNADAAAVNSAGLVTAVGVGTATITAASTADSTKTDTIQITVNPKEVPLPNLKTSKDVINVGESTSVDFSVRYEGDKSLGIYLLKESDEGFVPYLVDELEIQLTDDGDKGNGDLLQGDGIYSAKVALEENEQGFLNLMAGVQNGEEWQPVSIPTTIIVLKPFTEEEATIIANVTQDVQTKIDDLVNGGEQDLEVIKNLVVSELEKNDGVKEVGVSDSGKSVWYMLASGVLGAVTLEQEVTPLMQMFSKNTTQSMLAQNSIDELPSTQENSDNMIGNQLAAIFTAHGKTEGQEISELLTSAKVPFQVKLFKDSAASVEEFKKMNKYGAIFYDTKGDALFKGDLTKDYPYLSKLFATEDEKVVILTGEQMTKESAVKYNADLKTGRLVTVDNYYAITPAFVKHYGKGQGISMPKSLVYANSNQSIQNKSLGEEFINSGAQTYIGHKGEVTNQTMKETILEMLNGATLGESVDDDSTIIGNKDLIFALPQNLINGGFEEGLNGWIGAGHVDTISILGTKQNPDWHTLSPTKGNRMGIISSGLDENAIFGRQSWIYQTFTVPKGMTALKFDYNVVSNEPMEFIGSGFDDKFKATIVDGDVKEPMGDGEYEGVITIPAILSKKTKSMPRSRDTKSAPQKQNLLAPYLEDDNENNNDPDWLVDTIDENEVIIGFESINSSDWGQDYSDDRQRVDVVFPDDGDDTTYMTGWKTVTYDISDYEEETITLKLQTWDLGDTAYPTAVLFDNVHLAKSEHVGLDIQGKREITIPLDGEINEPYRVCQVDQYGDFWTGAITLVKDEYRYDQPVHELTGEGQLALKENVTGVSLDAQKGILTVTDDAQEGKITLIVSNDAGQKEVTVKLHPEEIASYTLTEYLADDSTEPYELTEDVLLDDITLGGNKTINLGEYQVTISGEIALDGSKITTTGTGTVEFAAGYSIIGVIEGKPIFINMDSEASYQLGEGAVIPVGYIWTNDYDNNAIFLKPQIVIHNNNGTTYDCIEVYGLNTGDTVQAYQAAEGGEALVPTDASELGIIKFSQDEALNPNGGTLYITITPNGGAESPRIPITYSAELAEEQITGLNWALEKTTVDISDPFITIVSVTDQDGNDVYDSFLQAFYDSEAYTSYDGEGTLAVFFGSDHQLEFARWDEASNSVLDITAEEVGSYYIHIEWNGIESNVIKVEVTNTSDI